MILEETVTISAGLIKQLRETTGAGILDCKKALEASGGDIEQATLFLQNKGLAAAAKKADRAANEGMVVALVDEVGSQGSLIELNCETDFVARTDDFQELARALARQVLEDRDVATKEALLAAPFIDNPGQTVKQQIAAAVAKLGENMGLRQVARFAAGDNAIIDSYVHLGGRIGVLIELDIAQPVSDRAAFQALAHDLTLQVAATRPLYLALADIPAEDAEAKKSLLQAQLAGDNKPDDIKTRIIEGKLRKWYEEVALMKQFFVRDNTVSIEDLLNQQGKALGAAISITRFARFEIGAG
jgi:elongation factor Ts